MALQIRASGPLIGRFVGVGGFYSTRSAMTVYLRTIGLKLTAAPPPGASRNSSFDLLVTATS